MMNNNKEILPTEFNDVGYSVMPYHDSEIQLQPYNKQYLGLASIISSSIGYPGSEINYISLTDSNGQALEFEVCSQSFQAIKHRLAKLNLSQSENLWLWVSVDSANGLEDWRLFKSHLPNHLIQCLYDNAQHFDSLLNLMELVQGFNTKVVRDFAESLLFNDKLMNNWLSIPASKQHHHSFPGGLMAHSLEVAQMVKHNLNLFENDVSLLEREITILAALLHDIGKTETIGLQQRTDLGQLVDHEKLTLLILAEALCKLTNKANKIAITLKYLLTWKSSDGFCKFIGGEIIKNADQISTKLSLRRMGFADKPDYYFYTKIITGGRSQYLNRL